MRRNPSGYAQEPFSTTRDSVGVRFSARPSGLLVIKEPRLRTERPRQGRIKEREGVNYKNNLKTICYRYS